MRENFDVEQPSRYLADTSVDGAAVDSDQPTRPRSIGDGALMTGGEVQSGDGGGLDVACRLEIGRSIVLPRPCIMHSL
jgi:hypothetical protein